MLVRALFCLTTLALASPHHAMARQGAPGTQGLQQPAQHDRLTFIGTSLQIDVLADVPGNLQVIRGQPGQISVTASATQGVAGFGLAGPNSDRLQLTAVDADRVSYVVVVPEGISVKVRLPDRHLTETMGTLQRSVSYSWAKGS